MALGRVSRAFSKPTCITWSRDVDRAVRRNLTLPSVRRRAHAPGAVWGISLVKNEADIIEATVRHQFAQGVEAMLIADNGSTDGTLDILHALSRELPLHVATDSLVAYEQSAKMSHLAWFADAHGAGWVLPFDADEFYYARRGGTVAEALRAADSALGVMDARLFNLFPTTDIERDTPLAEYGFRLCLEPSVLGKVAFRSHPEAVLAMGNHDVQRPGARSAGLVLLHLPWRSRRQVERKARQGVVAVNLADVPDSTCIHWKVAAGTDDGAPDTWDLVRTGTPDPMIGLPPGSEVVMVNPFGADAGGWRDLLGAAAD